MASDQDPGQDRSCWKKRASSCPTGFLGPMVLRRPADGWEAGAAELLTCIVSVIQPIPTKAWHSLGPGNVPKAPQCGSGLKAGLTKLKVRCCCAVT